MCLWRTIHTPKHTLRNRYAFTQWRTVSKDTHRDSQPHGRAVSKMFLPHFLWGPIRRAQSSAEPMLFQSLPLHMPALHDSQTGKKPRPQEKSFIINIHSNTARKYQLDRHYNYKSIFLFFHKLDYTVSSTVVVTALFMAFLISCDYEKKMRL